MSREELDRLLHQLEQAIAAVRSTGPEPERFGVSAHARGLSAGHEAVKKGLTSLLLMGTYRDLPEGARSEARVRAKFEAAAPEIYETISAARGYLLGMSEEKRARIDETLRRDPDLPMRVMETFDGYARRFRVPFEQRTFLRTGSAQLSWRLRTQGTKAVFDELTNKYDRALAHQRSQLGIPADEAQASEQPAPPAVRFRTRAQLSELRHATCSLSPNIEISGHHRPIDLQWLPPRGEEESRCRGPTAGDAIRGSVSTDTDAQGVWVYVQLSVPPDASPETVDALGEATKEIAVELRRRTERAPPVQPPQRLGTTGESCRYDADCDGRCSGGVCGPVGAPPSAAQKLRADAHDVAKVGLYLLIPPLCFVGVPVLLAALFMVIVSGFLGGD